MNHLNRALYDEKMQVMNFLNEVANRYPDAISFAPGRPLETFFDVENSMTYISTFVEHCRQKGAAGERAGYGALGQYGRTNGIIGELIAQLLSNDENIHVTAEDIIVTVGCQEAMCLCLLALCGNPNDVALIADPAYIGISGAAKVLGIEQVPIPCNEQGLDLEQLNETIKKLSRVGKNPRLLYLSPDFANPTGVTTHESKRAQLLNITKAHQIVVLEDHAYNYFAFDDFRPPALKSMPGSEHVLYLGSFSKSIFPGLRLGYIVADQTIFHGEALQSHLAIEISKIKSMITVNTSPICQAIAGGILLHHHCSLKNYNEPRRLALLENRNAMLECLESNFPRDKLWAKHVSWNKPSGGFFLTVNLPFDVTDNDLQVSAEQFGVLWTPMRYFFIEQAISNQIRLSFSYVTKAQIDAGIRLLAEMVKARIEDCIARATCTENAIA